MDVDRKKFVILMVRYVIVLVMLIGSIPLAAQDAEEAEPERGMYWRPPAGWVIGANYLLCDVKRGDEAWYAWGEVEDVMEYAPDKWAEVVRQHITTGLCTLSRGGETLSVVGEQEDYDTGRFALIVESADGLLFFISPYAFGVP